MVEALAPWVVGLVLALAGAAAGWRQIKKHGGETEKRKRAEGDADAANKIADRRGEALETAGERQRAAAAELRRRGVSDT